MRHVIAGFVALAVCSPAAAATLHVCPDGSGQSTTGVEPAAWGGIKASCR